MVQFFIEAALEPLVKQRHKQHYESQDLIKAWLARSPLVWVYVHYLHKISNLSSHAEFSRTQSTPRHIAKCSIMLMVQHWN